MFLSDVSVKRPVFATVVNLLLVVFGVVSISLLSLREYPDIDPPIVSINTNYPGASASIVETRITQLIEERISGIEGIKNIDSKNCNHKMTEAGVKAEKQMSFYQSVCFVVILWSFY